MYNQLTVEQIYDERFERRATRELDKYLHSPLEVEIEEHDLKEYITWLIDKLDDAEYQKERLEIILESHESETEKLESETEKLEKENKILKASLGLLTDLESFKVSELKEVCEHRGLNTNGKKQELIDRIQSDEKENDEEVSDKETQEDKKKESQQVDYSKLIKELNKLDGITYKVIGTWLWVDGDTKPVKEELKELGLKWSGNRKKWFKAPHKTTSKRKASKKSLEEIAKEVVA